MDAKVDHHQTCWLYRWKCGVSYCFVLNFVVFLCLPLSLLSSENQPTIFCPQYFCLQNSAVWPEELSSSRTFRGLMLTRSLEQFFLMYIYILCTYVYKCIGPNFGTQRVVNGIFSHYVLILDNMYQSVDLFPLLGLVYQKVLCMYNLCVDICIYKYSRYSNTYYMQLPLYIPCPDKSIKSPSFHFPSELAGQLSGLRSNVVLYLSQGG